MISITLPWPAKELSPNARVHWAKKASFTKTARNRAYMEIAITPRLTVSGKKGLSVRYTFHPKDKRRRDLDNLIASTKAYTDGIAQALGVDDSTFKLSYEMGSPACIDAMVRVTVAV